MAVKIRLKRMGKKKQPSYRVVVADSRSPRDGRIIESIGRYDPRQDPSLIEIDGERALHWLQTGAQPTDRARKLLEISGAWAKYKIARGEVYTVPERAPAKAEAAPAAEVEEAPVVDTPTVEAAPATEAAPAAEAEEAPAAEAGEAPAAATEATDAEPVSEEGDEESSEA